jgi:torulene dioxygenase
MKALSKVPAAYPTITRSQAIFKSITGATMATGTAAPTHFNNWPNSIGADSHYEERSPVELKVEGKIPSYVSGTLYRTGLGPRIIERDNGDNFEVRHWFDAFAQVHRFHINPSGSVIYNSRLTSDGLIEKARATGRLDGFSFAKRYEPCKSFFKKAQSVFLNSRRTEIPNEVNIGVTISGNYPGLSPKGQATKQPYEDTRVTQLTQKTDNSQMQMLDPETLEPVGLAEQTTLHPDLKGQLSAAHAEHDPTNGDVFNYNLLLGARSGTYKIFKTSATDASTSVLATFSHTPAYIHSLFLTENYVVLCVWNSAFTLGGASIVWNRNLLDSMFWNDKQPATWFVIDKRSTAQGGKGLVARYECDPFYCFHTINAFEETVDGQTHIVADLAGYEDMSVISKFYYENMLSDSPTAAKLAEAADSNHRTKYHRYRLAGIPPNPTRDTRKAVLEYKSGPMEAPELPTINFAYQTKKHRYIYGISDTGLSTFADSIIKYDTQTNEVKRWRVHGHTAGEAVFIANPSSSEEDGGVLLAVVLDGFEGKSYLLVLDARDLSTIAKAHVDGVVGIAFHGLWNGNTVDESTAIKQRSGSAKL